MATNPTIRTISRAKLFEVFKSKELVDLFEDILYGVGTSLPASIQASSGLADAAQATAESAQSNLNAHILDATDAHDATAISVAPAGTIASTNAQAALEELDGDIQALAGDVAANSAALGRYSRVFLLMGA